MAQNYLIVADTYYPDKNSAALQLRDLATELSRLGNKVTVLSARSDQDQEFMVDENGILILKPHCSSPKQSSSHLQRLVKEVLLPFRLAHVIRKYKVNVRSAELYVYSPSIFLFFVRFLLKIPKNKSKLILRDLFPYWAYDVGIIKSWFVFSIFNLIAKAQYKSFSKIYCQSERDTQFIKRYNKKAVPLSNWLSNRSHIKNIKLPLKISCFIENNKKTVIYSGSIGKAQNVKKLIDIAKASDKDYMQFLILGSGQDLDALIKYAAEFSPPNLLIHEPVSQECLTQILNMCDIGYISLDVNLRTHNVPGKFLNYLASGLWVLCDTGPNQELEKYFESYKIGWIGNILDGHQGAQLLTQISKEEANESLNCFSGSFSVERAVAKVLEVD